MSKTMQSQPTLGIGYGYSPKAQSTVVNLHAGYKAGNSHVYYNQLVHVTRDAYVPQIIGVRYGYMIEGFQPNVGADYQMRSHEKNLQSEWKLAYGLTKYFEALPIEINAGMSGKYFTATVGFYKVL